MLSLLRFLLEIGGFVVICLAVIAGAAGWRRLNFDRLLQPRDRESLRRVHKDRHPY